MGKHDVLKIQTYVLKVNIQCVCDGCKDKVKKLIQKTEGVYSTSIDAEQGKVVVSGVLDLDKLIKKLKKSGKHAQLWGIQKGNLANSQNQPANQFNNFGNGKGGNDNKPKPQKVGHGQQKGDHFERVQMNAAKDFKMQSRDQKSVKFNIEEQEQFDASDDDFDGSEDYDDEFDDEECEFGHGHTGNKMMPIMGNGHGSKGGSIAGTINGHSHLKNASKNGGREDARIHVKKGGTVDFPFEMNFNGGKQHGKNGKEENRGGSDSDGAGGKNKKGGKDKGGGGGGGNKNRGAKKSGSGLLGFLGFGKKSKKNEASTKKNSKSNSEEPLASATGNHKSKKGKRGGGEFDDFPDFEILNHVTKGGGGKSGKGGNGGGKVGHPSSAQMGVVNYPPMEKMSKMGKFSMDQTGDFSAVQGLQARAANGGYNYQGQAMQPPPSYQQYMPMNMMMNPQQQQQAANHQAANGNGMYQPMMYARPHPSMNYMPPPPMPSHPMSDPMTHIFSDENTESCSIM